VVAEQLVEEQSHKDTITGKLAMTYMGFTMSRKRWRHDTTKALVY